MAKQNLNSIFTEAGIQWGISTQTVGSEYNAELFIIIPVEPNVYFLVHETRPDIMVDIEAEF